MSTPSTDSSTSSSNRGRGRGKSRGGLGKYLRARGRGRGGRPAEFSQRLLLEGEGRSHLTEEEAAEAEKELREKYGRRNLGTNADRYKEEEPELDSDGEPIVEPEVDLSTFLEKQKISDDVGPTISVPAVDLAYNEDDVDESLSHITSDPSKRAVQSASRKGKVQQIEWDENLEELSREKRASEATKDLKDRFKAKSEKLKAKPLTPTSLSTRRHQGTLEEAPALPVPGAEPRSQIEEMEDFLDELIG
ncbi:hypothetical protein CPB83DRAFT_495904 [Crepidotus variabilis]|uniref:Uncharacterized protein n=1 Tax=Crepidotus variabilis TaxID=179855 RepID=A0A9P6EBW3_9AGAR|nr:hypothetical protein CPB83DRAFT_495904 [Crepidotus variabilis]